MRLRLRLIILLFLISPTCTVNAHNVMNDASLVLLTFDMRGGQKPRTADGPILKIYADGTIVSRATKPGDNPINVYLDETEFARLIKDLINDTDVMDITTATINSELKEQNLRTNQFPDAPITFLSSHLNERSTSISIKGVSAYAYLAPEASALQTLFSTQLRLLALSKKINAESE